MFKWQDIYNSKVVTAAEAAKVVKSGDYVEYAFGINCAWDFDEALSKRIDELWDVNIKCDIGAYPHFTAEADPTGEHFTWNSWHVSAHDKKYIHKTLYYIPMKFHELPPMTMNDSTPDDVAVVMCTPMDKHGYFNFGASTTNVMAMRETAKTFIVEVNANMPRCLGGGSECIHVTEVDMIIEGGNIQGKIIIIDFWASWCRPCRAENPNMTSLYADFHDKGLEILGVSLDKEKASWVKAIADDKLVWHHVSDLKFWNCIAAKDYGVGSIPSMFVLNSEHKIIAKNLRGEQLRAFVASKLN